MDATGTNKIEPIFIVGAPRSGTSLLRVILNRHPSIGLCDETYYFYYVYTRCKAFGDLRDASNRRRLIGRYLATDRIRRLGLDAQDLAAVLMREGTSYPAFFSSLMRFYALSRGKSRYGEKTPQHALFSSKLCGWYPHAKLIHVVRDPRDVVASLLRMPWGSRCVTANGRMWLDCALSAESCHHREKHLLVRYENLMDDPEAELRRVCTFLDEEYVPTMLVADNKTEVDRWWFQRAQEPLSRDQVEAWRRQLTREQVALIEWVVGSVMQQFGYERSGEVASVAARGAATCAEFFASVRQKIVKFPRLWYYWLQPTQLAKEEAWTDS